MPITRYEYIYKTILCDIEMCTMAINIHNTHIYFSLFGRNFLLIFFFFFWCVFWIRYIYASFTHVNVYNRANVCKVIFYDCKRITKKAKKKNLGIPCHIRVRACYQWDILWNVALAVYTVYRWKIRAKCSLVEANQMDWNSSNFLNRYSFASIQSAYFIRTHIQIML